MKGKEIDWSKFDTLLSSNRAIYGSPMMDCSCGIKENMIETKNVMRLPLIFLTSVHPFI